MRATAASAPRTSVRMSRPPRSPKTPGNQPAPIATKGAGNPLIVPPVSSTKVRPRKMSIPARVTMNAGMPTNATQKPCHAPTTAPTTREIATAAPQGRSQTFILIAATAPTMATIEPTDRSMCPAMMTITIPMARMSTYAFCWMRLLTLPGYNRRPSVRIWNNATMITNAARRPYCRRLIVILGRLVLASAAAIIGLRPFLRSCSA